VSTPLDIAPTDTPTDAAGEIFDPELHATKPDGSPSLKTDGTFRKKRRDAGGASTSAGPRVKATPPGAGMPRALKEQHAKHVRGIKDSAGVLLAGLSFASPVDAFSLEPLVDPFADALATVAQDEPRLAAALDKVGGLGGWGAVVAVVALGTVQVMHNHGKVPEPVVRMMGGKPRREIEQLLDQRAAAMRAEQEQQARMDAEMAEWAARQGVADA
jgi:hypothetical protein